MHLLDARGRVRRHDQKMVGEPMQTAAALAAQGGCHQPHGFRLLQGLKDVRALARGRDGDGDIARLAERLDLAGENLVEAEIVAAGGERRCVGGECEGGDGLAILLITDGQFRREMLAVGGAAAIAEEQKFSPAAQTCHASCEQGVEWRAKFRLRPFGDAPVLGEFLRIKGSHIHVRFRSSPLHRRDGECAPNAVVRARLCC